MLLTLVGAFVMIGGSAPRDRGDATKPPPGVAASYASFVRPAAHASDSLDIALYARVLKSADQRVLDSALLASALASQNVELRRVGARTLSQVAPTHRLRALPLLLALVNDADSSVASSAIFGLGLVRDTASISLLASIVRGAAPSAPAAAWALGEVGGRATDTVGRLLAGPRPDTGIALATTRALLLASSRIRPLPIRSVTPYLDSPDSTLRWAAAYAIARQHVRAGVRALLDVSDPDAAFRVELARELAMQTVGDSLRDRAVARLRSLIHDGDAHVRISALHSLGGFGALARSALLDALHDNDENVRVSAAQSATTAFGGDTAAWSAAWRADTTFKVRESLLESAASAGVVLPADAEWRTSSDWRFRSAAVAAWGNSRDTVRTRSIAMTMAHDSDGRVRGVAYGVLSASDTGRRDAAVQRALAAAKSDPDSVVRSAGAGAQAAVGPARLPVDRPIAWYENVVRRIVTTSLDGHPPTATMRTERGMIVITFDGVRAPLTVFNYLTLADRHFYDGLRFHRVVPGFVAQDGDPRGDGEGGPGYAIRDELTLLPYSRGAVGMALSGPDTGGSQYFLTLAPQPHLTGHYTVFGNVSSGLDSMDALVEGDSIISVRTGW